MTLETVVDAEIGVRPCEWPGTSGTRWITGIGTDGSMDVYPRVDPCERPF